MRSKQKTYELRVTSHKSKKGFTLLELIIVITIIGIGSALVGISIYRSLDNLKLKSSAKEVASALRYARSQAVAEKKVYIFSLDPEGKTYYVSAWGSSSKESPKESDDKNSPVSPSSNTIFKTLPMGITCTNNNRINIFFYPLGSSTGGRFSLTNEKGSTWSIDIEPSTGRVNLIK